MGNGCKSCITLSCPHGSKLYLMSIHNVDDSTREKTYPPKKINNIKGHPDLYELKIVIRLVNG